MSLEKKAHFGLLGETLVADLIRFQEKLEFDGVVEVKINTGPGLERGFGKRYHSSDGTSEVIPDIEIVKRPYGKPPRTEFAEVKTKSAFCCWFNEIPVAGAWPIDREIRTGIDVKAWRNYCWYYQKHFEAPLWLVFVHPLNLIQYRDGFGVCEDGWAGVYRAEIGQLYDLAKRGAGNERGSKIYWPVDRLQRWRSSSRAASDNASKRVWADLICEAQKQARRIKLITTHGGDIE